MEFWKTIPYATDYEASNQGRIRAKERVIITKDGNRLVVKQKVLKCGYTRKGYKRAVLSIGDISLYRFVHRLVADTWITKVDGKDQVNHINGIKDDNRVLNLEWVTNQENRDHAVRNNLIARGFRLPQTKLTQEMKDEIRRLYNTGVKQKDIAMRFGVVQQTISKIIKP